MEHNHHSGNVRNIGNAFKIGITLNVIFIILEVFFGFISNSMALISDAGHNFSDVVALIFSWIAVRLSQSKPTLKFTYGFRRSTILISILNTVILMAAVGFIIWEMVRRIGEPQVINSKNVMTIAAVGIVINGFTAWLFYEDKKRDLNIRSAFIHFMADALVSVGVVVAGLLIYITGISWIDSVVSVIIIAVILYNAYKLLIESVSLALDSVPENINIEAIREYLAGLPEVKGIHDLHIWALSTSSAALTVHLETRIHTDISFLAGVRKQLKEEFGIGHSTIQIESGEQPELCNDCN